MKVLLANKLIYKAVMTAAVVMATIAALVVVYGAALVTLAVAGVDIAPFLPVRCTEYW